HGDSPTSTRRTIRGRSRSDAEATFEWSPTADSPAKNKRKGGSTMSTFMRMLKSSPQLQRFAPLIVLCLAMAAPHVNAREDFGKVHFPVACNAGVQDEFDLALAMLHAFSFPAAAETFMAVAQKDPECAMAYWGLAATAIGSLYGGRPGPMALQGDQAVKRAQAIGGEKPPASRYNSHPAP